ncbi:MAG: hypothetical protein GKR95_06570 [Gammaproteobacteria bacterium]|nr:hypothetical protein [Gammaproteobacteria bacterium]
MSKYVFAYHGGKMPESEEEAKKVMSQWVTWLQGLGNNLIDGGNPVGKSSTVQSDGSITPDGGSNPLSGYSLIEADTMEQALEFAQGCPALAAGGSVEIAMAMEMN